VPSRWSSDAAGSASIPPPLLPPSVSDSAIRRAYFSRAKQLHPDKNPADDAEIQFRRLVEAKETLLHHADKRREYDELYVQFCAQRYEQWKEAQEHTRSRSLVFQFGREWRPLKVHWELERAILREAYRSESSTVTLQDLAEEVVRVLGLRLDELGSVGFRMALYSFARNLTEAGLSASSIRPTLFGLAAVEQARGIDVNAVYDELADICWKEIRAAFLDSVVQHSSTITEVWSDILAPVFPDEQLMDRIKRRMQVEAKPAHEEWRNENPLTAALLELWWW